MRSLLSIPFILFFLNCGNSPLTNGTGLDSHKLDGFPIVIPGSTSATVIFKCKAESTAAVAYGKGSVEGVMPSIANSKDHIVVINGLESQTNYLYSAFCGDLQSPPNPLMLTFQTLISDQPQKTRGIWLLGGIGAGINPIAQVDLYDPVANQWFPAITNIPTPRAYSNITSHQGKIYVMGGLIKTGGVFVAVNTVDEYDPYNNIWKTLSPMPDTHQGGIAISSGNDIYIIAGTTSANMATGTLTNTVYKFTPSLGLNGTWIKYISNTAIFQRVDMPGCDIQGTIFFSGGRRAVNDGLPFQTSDAYIPSGNTTTTLAEASINQARYGSAIACYRPNPKDPFPADPASILIAGGSSTADVFQPPGGITSSNVFDYGLATVSNFTAGGILPASLYYPAIEVSYELRRVFLFGGASLTNVPLDKVYSLDLGNPTTTPWRTESITLPVARFGHKAVILSR
ncbi:kelch repeat-containing protein [Leptospira sp. WS92.C1]